MDKLSQAKKFKRCRCQGPWKKVIKFPEWYKPKKAGLWQCERCGKYIISM